MTKLTTHTRIYKDMAKELKIRFPKTRMPDLLRVMYNTSLLKLESRLRKIK